MLSQLVRAIPDYRGAARSASWILAGNIGAAVCGVVTLPFLLRSYSLAEFSAYAAVIAIQQFCMSVAYAATGVGAARAFGAESTAGLVGPLIRQEVRAAACAAVLVAASIGLAWPLISGGLLAAEFIATAAPGVLFRLNGVVSASYRAQGRERELGVALIMQAAGRLVAIVIVAFLGLPIWVVLAGCLVVDAISTTYHRFKLSGTWFGNRSNSPVSETVFRTSSRWMALIALIDGAVANLDRLIVGAVLGQHAIGPYHVIRRYASILGLIGDPLYQVFVTRFSALRAAGKEREVARLPLQYAVLILPIVAATATVIWLTESLWQPLILPGFSRLDIAAFYIVLFGQAFAMCFIAVHPALMALDRWRTTVVITATANGVFVLSAILLGMKHGLVGVAASVAMQFSISVGLKSIYCLGAVRKK